MDNFVPGMSAQHQAAHSSNSKQRASITAEAEARGLDLEAATGDPGMAACCVRDIVEQRRADKIMAKLRAADPTRRALAQYQEAVDVGRSLPTSDSACCGGSHGHSHGTHPHLHTHGGEGNKGNADYDDEDEDEMEDELMMLRQLRIAQLQKQQGQQQQEQREVSDSLAKSTPLTITLPAITCSRHLQDACANYDLVLCAVVPRIERLDQDKLTCSVIEVLTRLSNVRGVHCTWLEWEVAGHDLRTTCARMSAIDSSRQMVPPCLLVLPRQHGTAVCVPKGVLERSVHSNGAWMLDAIGAAGARFRPGLCAVLMRVERRQDVGDAGLDLDEDFGEKEEEDQYCDKPGCGRTFAHEHIQRMRKDFASGEDEEDEEGRGYGRESRSHLSDSEEEEEDYGA